MINMQMPDKMLKESIYKPVRNKPSHHCNKYTEKIVDGKRNEPIKRLGFQQGCFLDANKLIAVFETHTCVLYLQGSHPLRVSAGSSGLETPCTPPSIPLWQKQPPVGSGKNLSDPGERGLFRGRCSLGFEGTELGSLGTPLSLNSCVNLNDKLSEPLLWSGNFLAGSLWGLNELK